MDVKTQKSIKSPLTITPKQSYNWERALDLAKNRTLMYVWNCKAEPRASAVRKELNRMLIYAAEKGKTDVALELIQEGADVNTRDFIGRTVLIRAATYGRNETVKMLITMGADINAVDVVGTSALMMAARYGYSKTVEILRQNGAEDKTILTGKSR